MESTMGGLIMSATKTRNGARDFDFWMGSWKVRNRYLGERLKGSSDWLEFEATSEARPLSTFRHRRFSRLVSPTIHRP